MSDAFGEKLKKDKKTRKKKEGTFVTVSFSDVIDFKL